MNVLSAAIAQRRRRALDQALPVANRLAGRPGQPVAAARSLHRAMTRLGPGRPRELAARRSTCRPPDRHHKASFRSSIGCTVGPRTVRRRSRRPSWPRTAVWQPAARQDRQCRWPASKERRFVRALNNLGAQPADKSRTASGGQCHAREPIWPRWPAGCRIRCVPAARQVAGQLSGQFELAYGSGVSHAALNAAIERLQVAVASAPDAPQACDVAPAGSDSLAASGVGKNRD